jgi:pyruvate/2-oxoglutarate/acetoin dehydrogenase E1 component
MIEEAFRNVAADSMAQGFIVEILLTRYLKQFPPADREEIAESLIKTGRRIDHFHGVAKDDEFLAELFSDVTIRMHAALEALVKRAMRRAAP